MYGIQTAVHFAGSPVGCMAAVHMISTLKDFIVMENHAVDIPWWADLVTGPAKAYHPERLHPGARNPGNRRRTQRRSLPGHLRVPGYFEPTPQFDKYILDEFRTGGPYPHLDENGKAREHAVAPRAVHARPLHRTLVGASMRCPRAASA